MRRDPRHARALPGTGHGPVRLSRRSQLQMDLPDAKHVAVLHERWRAYPRAVDVRAVRRTEVGDLHAVAAAPDPDMAPRNELVRAERRAEPDVPAEHDAPERYGDLTVRAGAGCDEQARIRVERRHAKIHFRPYSSTVPLTQLTVPPPTHTWPSASRET